MPYGELRLYIDIEDEMRWDAWEEASTCLGEPVGSVTHTVGMWDDQRETEVERQEEQPLVPV